MSSPVLPIVPWSDLAVEEGLDEPRVVLFGNAEEVGDHQHGQGAGEFADELALAPVQERVHLAVGEPPHELLVPPESLGRDQPHQQGAVIGVLRRIQRRELVAHRELVAVRFDRAR